MYGLDGVAGVIGFFCLFFFLVCLACFDSSEPTGYTGLCKSSLSKPATADVGIVTGRNVQREAA